MLKFNNPWGIKFHRYVLNTPGDTSHLQSPCPKWGSLQNKQLCFPNTLNWIYESGMALLQKREREQKRLEHIYQFANRLKSVNSGTQAIRNVLLILHQCNPFMWCNFILYKILSICPSSSVTIAQRGTERESQFQQWQKTAHSSP